MKQEFIRIKSTDNIEMCGVIYTPETQTNKAVIHVHGLSGNFYENRFVSYLAKMYTEAGYTFLTFNNRGYGYFTDLLKGNEKINFVPGGAYAEIFEECIYDIEGALNYLDSLGYSEYILQGHSYGCNKVVYYYDKKTNDRIKQIFLLAPCDIFSEFKREFKSDFNEYINKCKSLVEDGKGDEVVINDAFPPMAFTAKTLVNNFLENVDGDIFRYRDKNYISNMLKNIKLPVTVIIGSDDNCVFTESKDMIDDYLKRNIQNISIKYIDNSRHVYLGYETILADYLKEILTK